MVCATLIEVIGTYCVAPLLLGGHIETISAFSFFFAETITFGCKKSIMS
jgi:hypothetical protein